VTSAADLVDKHETSTFDWKQTYDIAAPGAHFEIAKDVAAFASAMGGTIIVGAVEGKGARKGYSANLMTVIDTGTLITEISNAVRRRCRPLPVFRPIVIRVSTDEASAIVGRAWTVGPVDLIAVNVWPLASGPVGVEVCDKQGQAVDDAYRFPMRGGEGTRFLLPEELALYLSSHERRIAVLLRQIPGTDATGQIDIPVHVYDRRVNEQAGMAVSFQLKSIDDARQCIVLEHPRERLAYSPKHSRATIPFTFIRAVWEAPESKQWLMSIDGTVLYYNREPFFPAGRTD
jgi:hypothetical protein